MSSNTDRFHSNIQDIVENGDKNTSMSSIQENLSKLRSLSSDDKTEAAMLRSRIDEQSQLIMILKKRADESGTSILTLEHINKELEDFRNSSQGELDMVQRRYNMLDGRFNDLASNHQELIKIKDEYKRVNEELRRENYRLREDNEKLFSKTIDEKDKKITDLDRKLSNMRQQNAALEARFRELQGSSKQAEEKQTLEIKELKRRLADTEERLKGTAAKLIHHTENQQSMDAVSAAKIQTLNKEKDDLLSLAMSRGKLIQEKQADNKKLEQKIQQMEKAVTDMENKFEREASAVNVNLQVRKLRAELEEADHSYKEVAREFQAFKKHSNGLLQKEKDLNAKLRHLMG